MGLLEYMSFAIGMGSLMDGSFEEGIAEKHRKKYFELDSQKGQRWKKFKYPAKIRTRMMKVEAQEYHLWMSFSENNKEWNPIKKINK